MPNHNGLDLLTFHHVGLLVENMEESIIHYSAVFGKQNISNNNFIELVTPLGESSIVSKLLKKKIGYYHMAYKVSDIKLAVKKLEGLNYKAMGFFQSEAFENKLCIFLFSPEGHLIELIEN